MQKLEDKVLRYRLTLDVLYIGKAAAELLDSKTKPKSTPGTSNEEEIVWDKSPSRKPLPDLSDKFRSQLTELKDCKNSISHAMKQKQADPEFLQNTVEDALDVSNKLIKSNCEDEVHKIIGKEALKKLQENRSVF